MEIKQAREAYRAQKRNAKTRGIEFLLTFEEWLEWWGDDLDKRGVGPNDLQMQRPADTGPYALGNIRKGTPKTNAVTMGRMERLRHTEQAGKERIAVQDAMMFAHSAPDPDPVERKHVLQPWRNRGDDPRLVLLKDLPKKTGFLGRGNKKVVRKMAKQLKA